MNSKNNIATKVLLPGTYECSSADPNESPQEIVCLDSGVITIYPINGDKFMWGAQTGNRLKVIPKKISIDSGVFMSFFGFFKNQNDSSEVEYYYLTDENTDSFVDENSNLIQIK